MISFSITQFMLVILLSFLLFTILSDALGVSGNRKEVGILNNMDSNSIVHRKSKDDDIAPTKSCFFLEILKKLLSSTTLTVLS